MELEKEINAILTKWNPIGVPEFIASDEYTDCIPESGGQILLILHRCNEGRDDKEDYKEVEL